MAKESLSETIGLLYLYNLYSVDQVRTVSDTKRKFYAHHTRPINSVYRRVVEELMVEMHLLSVNVNFRYDPIYALGVVTSFDRFMRGYRPEQDLSSIFNALCQAVQGDPQTYRQDAENLKNSVQGLSIEQISSWNSSLASQGSASNLYERFKEIAFNDSFKYSRLFAIGLYSLLEQIDAEVVNDEKQRNSILQELCESLKLSTDKVQKDLDLYRSNLEKMDQVQAVLEDALQAERKRKQKRALEKQPATPTEEPAPEASGEEDSSSEDTPSS
ncbi:photosystem II biogenesis protein Psp29 [Lusitaniella coriacea LEGE 07167]